MVELDCDYLEPVAKMLDDMTKVIRFEQRGCGRSDPSGPYDIETCLADLENIRNYYNVDRWIIGGHSWGADLALVYALEHSSQVSGLMCISVAESTMIASGMTNTSEGKTRKASTCLNFSTRLTWRSTHNSIALGKATSNVLICL